MRHIWLSLFTYHTFRVKVQWLELFCWSMKMANVNRMDIRSSCKANKRYLTSILGMLRISFVYIYHHRREMLMPHRSCWTIGWLGIVYWPKYLENMFSGLYEPETAFCVIEYFRFVNARSQAYHRNVKIWQTHNFYSPLNIHIYYTVLMCARACVCMCVKCTQTSCRFFMIEEAQNWKTLIISNLFLHWDTIFSSLRNKNEIGITSYLRSRCTYINTHHNRSRSQ